MTAQLLQPGLRLSHSLGARRHARGVAALTVVMVLFFVMALVAAYTNRNLVFEQRISANGYRATRALEAADAGVEWTMAMLNGGRTTANCTQPPPEAAAATTDFRSRYLLPSEPDKATGELGFGLPWGQFPANRVYPACIIVDGNPRCICPAVGEAPADINAPADGIGTAFRITFRLFDDVTRRVGAIQFVSRGCANPGTGNTACFAQTDTAPAVDSTTAVITTVGLVRALPIKDPRKPETPFPTLSAGTSISTTNGAEIQVSVELGANLKVVRAGRDVSGIANPAVNDPGGNQLAASDIYDANNFEVRGYANQGPEAWFRHLFQMDRATYQRLPATIRIDCAAGCNSASLNAALLMYPQNPIWLDGDLNLNGGGAIGSNLAPAMLIVNGNLTVASAVQAIGFVHANQIRWTDANAQWTGAMVSATSFSASAKATLNTNLGVLNTIRLNYGSFVRAPGGWNLF